MGRRSTNKKANERSKAKHKPSGLRRGLSIGALAFVMAVIIGGPIGAVLQRVNVLTATLFLAGVIGLAIVADIVAVAVTAAQDVPFNAMASNRVPGSHEALHLVRSAGKVNSLLGDVVGDIAGTISGVVATPLIFLLGDIYPNIPSVIVSALVIGLIAAVTVGGKAAEKDFAVRNATAVILFVGKAMHFAKSLWPKGKPAKKSRR